MTRRTAFLVSLACLPLACAADGSVPRTEPPRAAENTEAVGQQTVPRVVAEPPLFHPQLFDGTPFDPATEKCRYGYTVAEAIRVLSESRSDVERLSKALALAEECHGMSFRFMQVPDRQEREAMLAAVAAGRIGPRARFLAPVLAQALDDPSRNVRLAIAHGFLLIGPAAADAAPMLRQALADDDIEVRLSIALALHAITHEVDLPLQTALDALEHVDPDLRIKAVSNLEFMEKDARLALPRLEALANTELHEDVRRSARQALEWLGR